MVGVLAREHEPTISEYSPQHRAALIFTGHLRETCGWNRTTSAMEDQAASCRSAFQGRCDIFVHTWDELQKTTREHLNSYIGRSVSAWPCAGRVAKVLRPTAMTVENQARAYNASPVDNTPLGDAQELPLNFRMNTASMAGGISLMLSHAHTMGLHYTAAVRMRADLSTTRFQTLLPAFSGRDYFPTREAWLKIRARAEQAANGSLPQADAAKLVTCRRPHKARGDWCFWSTPPQPLLETVLHLNRNFDQVHAWCEQWLRQQHLPPFSENLLRCAMLDRNISYSTFATY